MKQIWEADKLLLVFTLFKNSIEQVFYVFFFVYLTKYIFNCIENNIEYSRLFWFLVIACSGHICIHFICGWYETYRKIKTPEVYRHIFHRVIDLSDTLELKDYESPEFYDKYARALDNCVDQAMNIAITFTDAAVTAIADKGFDDAYGARPLRRAIQSEIEDTLSEYMLDGKVVSDSKVTCDFIDGKFDFKTE